MIAVDVRTRFFRFQPPSPLVSSLGSRSFRTLCLVEVETEDGLIGLGESWTNFPHWGAAERHATLMHGIRPLIVGQNVSDVIGTHYRLFQQLERIGLQWGSPGAISQAISGVDLALWDLAGKRHKIPVYQLLGGGRSHVPVYASGLGPIVDEDIIRRHRQMGINVFKLKVGFGLDQDIDQINRLRKLVGPSAHILVDANQAWTVREALTEISAMKPFQIDWIEEPVRADDFDAMATVVERSPIPIAAGENLYGRSQFASWSAHQALNIAQPDITKVGGLSEAWVIAQMVRSWHIPYAPHFLGSVIGLAATCHLFSAVPGGLWVELDSNPNALREEIAEPLAVRDGLIAVPQDPGLGIRLKESTLKKYEIGWDEASA